MHNEFRGIPLDKKNNIIKKLYPLMPDNRKIFWESLKINEKSKDLIDNNESMESMEA